MAIYRLQRQYSLNSRFQDIDDKSIRLKYSNPESFYLSSGGGYVPFAREQEDATREILKTGKTNGKAAKKHVRRVSGYFGAMGTVGGAIIGKSKGIKGAVVGAALGGLSSAAGGYGITKASHKSNQVFGKTFKKRTERILDNMDVAEGKMTESEFNKKWKKK